MGQGWLLYTAAVCAPAASGGEPASPHVRFGVQPVGDGAGSGHFTISPPAHARAGNRYRPFQHLLEPRDGAPPAREYLVRAAPAPTVHPEPALLACVDEVAEASARPGGVQAVMRAVDILLAVAEGPVSLPELVGVTAIPKATCHRIAAALAERGLLATSGRSGFRLGPVLRDLVRRAHP